MLTTLARDDKVKPISDESAFTIIYHLAHANQENVLRIFLVENNLKIDHRWNRLTPIEFVASQNNLVVVKFLIAKFNASFRLALFGLLSHDHYDSVSDLRKNISQDPEALENMAFYLGSKGVSFDQMAYFIHLETNQKKRGALWAMAISGYASQGHSNEVNKIISNESNPHKQFNLKNDAVCWYALNGFPGDARNLIYWESDAVNYKQLIEAAVVSFAQVKDRIQVDLLILEEKKSDRKCILTMAAMDGYHEGKHTEEINRLISLSDPQIKLFLCKHLNKLIYKQAFMDTAIFSHVPGGDLAANLNFIDTAAREKKFDKVVLTIIKNRHYEHQHKMAVRALHFYVWKGWYAEADCILWVVDRRSLLTLRTTYISTVCYAAGEDSFTRVKTMINALNHTEEKFELTKTAARTYVSCDKDEWAKQLLLEVTDPGENVKLRKVLIEECGRKNKIAMVNELIPKSNLESSVELRFLAMNGFARGLHYDSLNDFFDLEMEGDKVVLRERIIACLASHNNVKDSDTALMIVSQINDQFVCEAITAKIEPSVTDVNGFLKHAKLIGKIMRHHHFDFNQANSWAQAFKLIEYYPWLLMGLDVIKSYGLSSQVYLHITSYLLELSDAKTLQARENFITVAADGLYRYSLFQSNNPKACSNSKIELNNDADDVEKAAFARYEKRMSYSCKQ